MDQLHTDTPTLDPPALGHRAAATGHYTPAGAPVVTTAATTAGLAVLDTALTEAVPAGSSAVVSANGGDPNSSIGHPVGKQRSRGRKPQSSDGAGSGTETGTLPLRANDPPQARLDNTGALVRRLSIRLGSQISSVGAEAALQLLLECETEEATILDTLVERRYLTLAQLTRVFYSARALAYRRLQALYLQRGVSRCVGLPSRVASFVGNPKHPEPTYFLDWNGKMAALLRAGQEPEDDLPGWDEKTIPSLGMLDAHRLGVNEAWSLLAALARQTYAPGNTTRRVTIGWRGEADAQIEWGTPPNRVKPDAELLLCFRPAAAGEQIATDWQQALLTEDEWPTPAEISTAYEQESGGLLIYRSVVLEFETGQHNRKALAAKIAGYNTLLTQEATYQARYGSRFPRLWLVVPGAKDRREQSLIWRKHYSIRPKSSSTAVPLVLTSLEELHAAEAQPGGLLQAPIWWHVMDPDHAEPTALTFWQAFNVAAE